MNFIIAKFIFIGIMILLCCWFLISIVRLIKDLNKFDEETRTRKKEPNPRIVEMKRIVQNMQSVCEKREWIN